MGPTGCRASILLIVVGALARNAAAQGATVVTGGGFVPAGQVLYATDFTGVPIGTFPSGLKYLRGPMEVVMVDGVPMLRSTGPAEFIIPLGAPLPQDFTLEFDLVARNSDCCTGEELAFEGSPQLNRSEGSAWVAWHHNGTGIIGGGYGYGTSTVSFSAELRGELLGQRGQIQVMMSGTQFKLYTNGRQIYNIPDLVFRRSNVLRVFLGGVDDGTRAVYLARVRLATGGPAAGVVAANPAPGPTQPVTQPTAQPAPPPPPAPTTPPSTPTGAAPAGPRPSVPAPPVASPTPPGSGPVIPVPPPGTSSGGTGPAVPTPPPPPISPVTPRPAPQPPAGFTPAATPAPTSNPPLPTAPASGAAPKRLRNQPATGSGPVATPGSAYRNAARCVTGPATGASPQDFKAFGIRVGGAPLQWVSEPSTEYLVERAPAPSVPSAGGIPWTRLASTCDVGASFVPGQYGNEELFAYSPTLSLVDVYPGLRMGDPYQYRLTAIRPDGTSGSFIIKWEAQTGSFRAPPVATVSGSTVTITAGVSYCYPIGERCDPMALEFIVINSSTGFSYTKQQPWFDNSNPAIPGSEPGTLAFAISGVPPGTHTFVVTALYQPDLRLAAGVVTVQLP